jgi:hypothetical protein
VGGGFLGQRPRHTARLQFAQVLLADLRRLDEQRRDTRRRLATMVAASKTRLTDIYGVGPIIPATVLGLVGDISRFPSRDHFAAYNGTAPIEVSSGNRRIRRLSPRGNRQLNHAIHMAAVTQIRYPGTIGRNYYDRKLAEGMAHKSALRALKRRISDALYAQLIADHRRTTPATSGIREGKPLVSSTLLLPGEDQPMNDGWTIKDRFDHEIDAVIDSGGCGTVPTTVVDLTQGYPEVVRVGAGDPSPFV